ncbi:MAG: hemerythrin domain-containing protein [Acidimicrobiaceae bacterium]|nr:hemerythrin domain-containing protein [Acidimicrobiaceae bacterium]
MTGPDPGASFAPVDLIMVAHNGLRRDLTDIDAAALRSARKDGETADVLKRLEFFTAMLSWHAQGEDGGIFPALERVAPDVSASYEIDHRGLDLASEGLDRAVDAGDDVGIARATAAFKFHLDMHLHKEEVHLYRLFVDRLTVPEQGEAVGVFTDALPRDRFADFVGWLFPLVELEDRARVVRVWQVAMPPPVFAGTMGLLQRVLGDDYSSLAEIVPELTPP